MLVPLIVAGLISVIKWGGEYFYVYAWLFVFIVTMVRESGYYCYEIKGTAPPIHIAWSNAVDIDGGGTVMPPAMRAVH